MSLDRHDIIRYLVSAAAFLGALVVTNGCTTSSKPAAKLTIAPAAGSVNAYGEFGAAARVPGTTGQTSVAFQQHTFAVDGRDIEVTVDPTGKFLAYSSTRNSIHPDIYLQRVDGVSVVQLTDDPADDAFPAFSPDGKTIAFSSTRGGNWDIYTMDTDGRHVVQITSSQGQELHPSFSPDGTRLVYCSTGSRSDNWELWVVNLQTGEKRMIGYGLFPVWSPEKGTDRIAFQRASQRGSRWFSLWTLDLVDGEARRVTEVASSADAAIVSPAWSPDGQRIAFTSIRRTAGPVPGSFIEQKEIGSVSVDGTDRRRLTDGIGANLNPIWAVDNRVYFISDRGGSPSVWSVQADQAPSAVAAKPTAAPAEAKANQHEGAAGAVGSVDTHEVTH